MKRRTHPNSAVSEQQSRPMAMTRRGQIDQWLSDRPGERFTDRQIKGLLLYSDMNAVRPRITELLDDPSSPVVEGKSVKDSETGRMVRTVYVPAEQLTMDFSRAE